MELAKSKNMETATIAGSPNNIDNRVIVVNGITEESAHHIVSEILRINMEDLNMSAIFTDYKPQPIRMIMSSGGGSVYAGLSIIGAMRASNTHIITYNYGISASMGFMIFLFGHERMADKYSVFMWHDMSTFIGGKLESMKDDMESCDALREQLVEITLERTKIKKAQLTKMLKNKKDWYIYSAEALKLGICDGIQ